MRRVKRLILGLSPLALLAPQQPSWVLAQSVAAPAIVFEQMAPEFIVQDGYGGGHGDVVLYGDEELNTVIDGLTLGRLDPCVTCAGGDIPATAPGIPRIPRSGPLPRAPSTGHLPDCLVTPEDPRCASVTSDLDLSFLNDAEVDGGQPFGPGRVVAQMLTGSVGGEPPATTNGRPWLIEYEGVARVVSRVCTTNFMCGSGDVPIDAPHFTLPPAGAGDIPGGAPGLIEFPPTASLDERPRPDYPDGRLQCPAILPDIHACQTAYLTRVCREEFWSLDCERARDRLQQIEFYQSYGVEIPLFEGPHHYPPSGGDIPAGAPGIPDTCGGDNEPECPTAPIF